MEVSKNNTGTTSTLYTDGLRRDGVFTPLRLTVLRIDEVCDQAGKPLTTEVFLRGGSSFKFDKLAKSLEVSQPGKGGVQVIPWDKARYFNAGQSIGIEAGFPEFELTQYFFLDEKLCHETHLFVKKDRQRLRVEAYPSGIVKVFDSSNQEVPCEIIPPDPRKPETAKIKIHAGPEQPVTVPFLVDPKYV